MDTIRMLSGIPLFSKLQESSLRALAEHSSRLQCGRGEVIIREGEHDGRLFIIIDGEVEAVKNYGRKNEIKLRRMNSGSYFGEMSLIDALPRSASVIAFTDTKLLSLDRANLHRTIDEHPSMAIELLQVLTVRLREMEKKMLNTLSSFIVICSSCKMVSEADGTWVALEKYVTDHSPSELTHGLCPKCIAALYPEIAARLPK